MVTSFQLPANVAGFKRSAFVLTRYARSISGAPRAASTNVANRDPSQPKNNIKCVGCALDMNGDGQIAESR